MPARRFRRPLPPWPWLVALLVILVAGQLLKNQAPPDNEVLDAGEYRVVRAVDGDTLLLDHGRRLRLIGVNAPESVKPESPVEPWGPEASEFTSQFIHDHLVRLEFDRERFDQYHRMLAYVWVGDKLLNEELLRAGLARWESQYHYSALMRKRFQQAEQAAKKARLGIWSAPSNGAER